MADRIRHRPPVRTPPSHDGRSTAPDHSHRVPRSIVWAGSALVAATLAGLLLLAAYAYSTTARLSAVEQVIDSRTADRDAQTAQLRQELRTAVCDVLDRLPPAPELDDARADYGCGPGTILEENP